MGGNARTHPSGPDSPPARRRGGARSVATGLAAWVRAVARVVLPVECPGCGAWDEVLCAACAGALGRPVRRCETDVPRLDRLDGAPPMPVWTVSTYVAPIRGVVVAWKDRGRVDLTPRLVAAVRRGAVEAAPVLREICAGDVVHVVPVPSSPGARRRRGSDLVRSLAVGAAEGLRSAGVPATVSTPLVRRRGRRDQVGLGARARSSNTAGSVRVRRHAGARRRPAGRTGPTGRLVVLVDDIVTTGSTLAACEDALSASGGLVLGALVLAATPGPRQDLCPLPASAPDG